MQCEANLSERIYRRLLVAFSEDYLQLYGAPMMEDYRDFYEDNRSGGRLVLAWKWLRELLPDLATSIYKDRRERGQRRELGLVLLVFALVLGSGLYSVLALTGGALSVTLLGIRAAELWSVSGVSIEEAGPLMLSDFLMTAMFLGIALGAIRFSSKVCREGLVSEHL